MRADSSAFGMPILEVQEEIETIIFAVKDEVTEEAMGFPMMTGCPALPNASVGGPSVALHLVSAIGDQTKKASARASTVEIEMWV